MYGAHVMTSFVIKMLPIFDKQLNHIIFPVLLVHCFSHYASLKTQRE